MFLVFLVVSHQLVTKLIFLLKHTIFYILSIDISITFSIESEESVHFSNSNCVHRSCNFSHGCQFFFVCVGKCIVNINIEWKGFKENKTSRLKSDLNWILQLNPRYKQSNIRNEFQTTDSGNWKSLSFSASAKMQTLQHTQARWYKGENWRQVSCISEMSCS